jgi:hypothetical protein
MSKRQATSNDESVRQFWWHLLPIGLLPTLLVCIHVFTGRTPTIYVVAPLLSGCCLYAALPYLRGKAPHTFWQLACVVFGLGGLLGMGMFVILTMARGILHSR